MDKGKIESFAKELFIAERSHCAIQPITVRAPSFGVDDAYGVQMLNVARATAMGHKICGKKIGLTSEAIQRQLGVGEPDYGHLFAAMNCAECRVDAEALIQPKIEAELAFILRKDLAGGCVTAADVDDATDYVVAAFEIVDSRIADWRLTLPDTVADNASSGRFVLGSKKIDARGMDLSSVSMKLYKVTGTSADTDADADADERVDASAGADLREELVNEGLGSAVMGDPRIAVAWLANKLWAYGVTLKAGEVVLSGAFTAAPAARKGDAFRADFSGFCNLAGCASVYTAFV